MFSSPIDHEFKKKENNTKQETLKQNKQNKRQTKTKPMANERLEADRTSAFVICLLLIGNNDLLIFFYLYKCNFNVSLFVFISFFFSFDYYF